MELTIYDIIAGPVKSEKAYQLNKKQNQLMLHVHIHANKVMIKKTLEKLFKVKVDKVRTTIRKDSKIRIVNRRHNANPGYRRTKIAYVSLAQGYSLNLFEQTDAVVPSHGNEK